MKKTSREENDFSNVCLFVSSSDNTRDVFLQVFPAYDKFWPDLPFQKYVGLNTATDNLPEGFQAVYAPVSGWKTELYHQIQVLSKKFEYILLFLDDFLILSQIDTKRVEMLLRKGIKEDLAYLCLSPLYRAWLPRLGKRLTTRYRHETMEKIKNTRSYYSSLQVALWERKHLLDMLKFEGDIWDFENQYIPGVEHYAVVSYPAIPYIHVVEKGRWVPNVKALFREAGMPFEPFRREIKPKSHLVWFWINKVKFGIIGYLVVRLKRWVPKLKSIFLALW